MKKFSPPQMKEVSFPTPHTPDPTPSFKSEECSEIYGAIEPICNICGL